MNTFWVVLIVVGIITIISFGAFAIVKANSSTEKTTTQISCSGCQEKCTAEKNCGLSTCGAVNGGTCGCSKARA